MKTTVRTTHQYYDMLEQQTGKNYLAETDNLAGLIRTYNPRARTILDVGCATGLHAHLMRRNFSFKTDAIDIDPEMVKIAGNRDFSGKYAVADMRDFDLGRKYDAIMCMFTTIGYARSVAELTAALTCFKKHLNDGGVLVVEPWETPESFDENKFTMYSAQKDDLQICRMTRGRREGHKSILRHHWMINTPGGIEKLVEEKTLSLFTRDEMTKAFNDAGFGRVTFCPLDKKFSGRGLYIAMEKPKPAL